MTLNDLEIESAGNDHEMTLRWPQNDRDSRAFDVVEHRPIDFNESKRRIFDDSAATQGGSEEWKPNAYQVRLKVKIFHFWNFWNSVLSMMMMMPTP